MHFDICMWATISQDYNEREVLQSLLGSRSELNTDDLRVILHKTLFSRRYLIVLDDLWSCKVWDDIRRCSPDDNNGSRIILTTRENYVAEYIGSKRHELHLLNKEDCWELFKKLVHGGEKCPNELEEVARKIVNNCGGLPLAVKVIGGYLSRVKRSRDLWERVAHDVSSFVAKEDEHFSGIFSWSYAYLPHYLKPCLLYMGAFPENHVIRASRLIKLWVAEGFLHPIKDKNPEEVAEMYLKALVDRNLIFVRKSSFSRKVKSYGMHDLLRDLCLRKAGEKKLIFAKNLNRDDLLGDALCHRRICASASGYSGGSMKLMPMVHSFQIIGGVTERFFPNRGFRISLLRILDVLQILFDQFPEEIFKLINLRYLAIHCDSPELSESIILLSNLETIILEFQKALGYSQMRIFDLPRLRHVTFRGFMYPPYEPIVVPRFTYGGTLQSLCLVSVKLLAFLLGRFPNLRKLEIYDTSLYGEKMNPANNIDLTCFQKLETIRFLNFGHLNPTFPYTLKKLTLRNAWKLSRTFMSRIGALPNLELLRLLWCDFKSETWEPSEGEFCNLRYLWLVASDLENLIANETNFPQLTHLFINSCNLKEIPAEFAQIETLEVIEVDYCRPSVFDSARSILQELDFGNDGLQLRLGMNKLYNRY